ncbi:hypothetical protein CAMGR0001_1392 [Campylobacter gracilis RM3268]|uniref:Uncharacterized protein n=1 Tax=Campylobacter gracilis RM3268 TaxID=553220 RepID=C8PJJ2_9BACT|nr:hypothetical protein CAMGR0001_1392 [Campylobacter gracilis RM3268]
MWRAAKAQELGELKTEVVDLGCVRDKISPKICIITKFKITKGSRWLI